MSSIIVELSSDSEDEAPKPKKAAIIQHQLNKNLKAPIRATNAASTNALQTQAAAAAKARLIPSSITVTRHNAAVTTSPSNANILTNNANSNKPVFCKVNKNTTQAKSKMQNISKSGDSVTITNAERQTPTPPIPKQQQQQQQTKITAVTTVRKRKTPTPPVTATTTTSLTTQRNLHTPPVTLNIALPPAKATTLQGSLQSPVVTPTIISVHSMAASATPPLRLLATPPPPLSSTTTSQAAVTPALTVDPLVLLAPLTQLSLPASTTITAQLSSPNQSTTSKNQQPQQQRNNNNNNNSKYNIQRSNSIAITENSPAQSPVMAAAATNKSKSTNSESSTTKRIKPITILRKNDDAWINRMEELPTSGLSSPKTKNSTPLAQKSISSLAVTPKSSSSSPSSSSPKSSTNSKVPKIITNDDVVDDGTVVLLESPPATPQPKLNGNTDSKNEESLAALEPEYESLLQVCRDADKSADMEKLIQTRLIKYYYSVHGDFVKSRGFRKNVRSVQERIRSEPDLVYYHLKTIVDELKVRRKAKAVVLMNNEEPSTSNSCSSINAATSPTPTASTPSSTATATASATATATVSPTTTGNKRTDEQIRKLNRALYILTKRIESLEQAEVDWNDDDSSYLQMERFKKRACLIYEKICDLTGESKNAHRLVKKPIQFKDTAYPQFNKTLQGFINRTKEFPDYFDVLRMLEHCNRQYNLGLANFEMKRIAHDAFTKVGKLLQTRRKTDLYETVTHFTANAKDPAAEDPILLAKLSENLKNQTRISAIIEKFAREQDLTAEEQKEARLQEKQKTENGKNDNDTSSTTSENQMTTEETPVKTDVLAVDSDKADKQVDNDADATDDDDDDDEETDEDELDEQVENLANGDDIISDAESEIAFFTTTTTATANVQEILDSSYELVEDENKQLQTTTTTMKKGEDKIVGAKNALDIVEKHNNTINNNSNNNNNNNNITRNKTGIGANAIIVPNGKLKQHLIMTAGTTDAADAAEPTIGTSISTEAAASTKLPSTLKIISVSSLNARVVNSVNKIEKPTQPQLVATATTTIKTAQKQQHPQHQPLQQQKQQQRKERTVAEIVISDEES